MGSGASTKAAFGSPIGDGPRGVVAHSSHYGSLGFGQLCEGMSAYATLPGGGRVYTGFKWQCVEYARRWWILTHGVTFGSVGMAYEIFDLPHFTRAVPEGNDADAPPVAVDRVRNGRAGLRPTEGTVLLWEPQGFFAKTGHVAIVTAASDTWVRVAEQNVTDAPWGAAEPSSPPVRGYSREIPARVGPDGQYTISDPLPGAAVLGWVHPRVAAAEA